MRKQILVYFALCMLTGITAIAQTVTGVVTSMENGEPLPGVSVLLKGTSTGTVTDLDGNYSLEIDDAQAATLVFSFMGYVSEEVALSGRTSVDITLAPDLQQLDEIIVTALGIERDQSALNYSVQKVSPDELAEARSLNVVNSLSGKVAGLNFSTTGSGVGSSSRVVLRGNRSLTGNNQPLYVVDGVPIDNTVSTTSSDIGGVTTSDGISNLNPEDIASISVLKGPSAAALYGTRASNGVIIINTKKGEMSKGAKVSVTSNLMFSKAYNLLDLQNQYGQGNDGTYDATSRDSWGPAMEGQSVSAWQLEFNPNYEGPSTYALTPQPDNVNDFFKTGYNWAKGISATLGNEKMQGYFSYTNTEAEGVVEGNELDRHNLNLRLTSDLSEKVKLDVKTNYIVQEIENALNTGESSVGEAAYTLIRSMPYSQYKEYQYIDEEGQIQYNYPDPTSVGGVGGNPYWFALNRPRTDKRNRFIGFASLKYKFTNELSLQIRSGLDQIADKTNISDYANISILGNDFGSYAETYADSREFNNDFLLTYNKIAGDFDFNVNVGGNALLQTRSSQTINGQLSRRNFFAISNIETPNVSSDYYDKRINSLYGFAQIGYKEYLFLDVTARNDWSSALPADNRSFFYPSVGVTGILSEIFDIDSETLSFLKVRASYAQVGNDTDPYQLSRQLIYSGSNGGIVSPSTTKANPNLKPEISTSLEWGIDTRFFNDRLGLDFTWFKTNTVDQIFTINTPESSGYSYEVINGGEVENKGVELTLNANIVQSNTFNWDLTANFARYNSKIISISDDREELVFGDGRIIQSKITKGGEYGDLFIRGFNRTDDGDIIVDENGIPEFTSGFDVRAGNFNPDWTAGLQNRLEYNNFYLSFLIDFRIGGEVISYTQARLAGIGASSMTLNGREEDIVVDGVVATRDDDGNIVSTTANTTGVSAESYWSQVATRDPRSAEDFVYDATNIRLRELVLGYNLPHSILERTPFTGVNISLVGRNLFFIVNKAELFDPEQGVGVGNLQGVESFNVPTTRDFGFNVKLDF